MVKTCYVAAFDLLDKDAFSSIVDLVEGSLKWEIVFSLKPIPDIILYADGGDICTKMYGKGRKPTDPAPDTFRDGVEAFCFEFTQLIADRDVWNIGIGRGMQLLSTMNGGKAKDIEGHQVSKDDLTTPSVSHQVEYLGKTKQDTYGMSIPSDHKKEVTLPDNGKEKFHPYEVLVQTLGVSPSTEAIFFPKTKSIGVQWQPDSDADSKSFKLFKRILDDYMEVA